MSETHNAARPAPSPTRRVAPLVGAIAVLAAVLVAVPALVRSTDASAAPPVVGDPGVQPPIDLSTLEANPIKQWGVEGTGNTYSDAKPHVWDFLELTVAGQKRMYVAGAFTTVRQNGDDPNGQVVQQPYLAAFDLASGAYVPTFTPAFNRAVYDLEVAPNGKLLVGGEFTTVNGQARTGLVMIDPATGATDAGFAASITAANQPMVREILRVGSQIYVAGQISQVKVGANSYWVWNAARLNGTTGAIDGTWVPKFMGGLWDLTLDPVRDRVHAVGFFTSVDGQPGTARFASVTRATGAYIPGLAAFQTNTTGQMDTIAVAYADDRIYVGGAQHSLQVLDAATNQRIGFNTTGITCNAFFWAGANCNFEAGGDYQVLEVSGQGPDTAAKILAGCHCFDVWTAGTSLTAKTHYSSFTNSRSDLRVAIGYNTSDSRPSSTFVPELKPHLYGTYAIETDTNGCYWVGGYYTRARQGYWLGGFGRFCRPVSQPASLAAYSAQNAAFLSWQAPGSQLPVAYYKVYRGGTFVGDTTGTSFGVGGLTPASSQTFTVRTMDVSGRLSPAATVTVVINGADTSAPTAPASLTGTASGTTVSLAWTAATDDQGVKEYLVHRNGVYVGAVGRATLSYTHVGAPAGSNRYEVRARDHGGNIGPPAVATVSVAGQADTQAPTVPANATGTASGTTVTLSWAASSDLPAPGGVGLSGYLIHRDWNFVKFLPAGTTTFTDTGVALGNRRYEVRAIDLNSNISAPAPAINVTIGTPDTQAPAVPANVSGTVSGTTVTLSWGASSDLPDPGGVGLSGYLIHRDWNFVKFVPAGTTTTTDVGVVSGNRRYEVRAVDRNNNISAPAPAVVVAVP